MKSTLPNMIIVLGGITLIAAVAVGGVSLLTKEPIEAAKQAKITGAIAEVMPGFDNDPSTDKQTLNMDGRELTAYTAKQGDSTIGYAIETFTNKGFGGDIKLMVGITSDGMIKSISVLEQKETPGLGDKINKEKSDFSLQFDGKSPDTFKMEVKKDGGDVDAITASTISSRAFCDAVERAYTIYNGLNKK